MSLSDPIADMLTRLRNAINARHLNCRMPHSKLKEKILDVFKLQGYISDYKVVKDSKFPSIVVDIKYYEQQSVINELVKISKPGKRIYIKSSDIRPYKNNIGNLIISTSKGILTGRDAKKLKLGGEVICKIS